MAAVINLGEMSQTYYFSIDLGSLDFFFFGMMKSAMLSVRFM